MSMDQNATVTTLTKATTMTAPGARQHATRDVRIGEMTELPDLDDDQRLAGAAVSLMLRQNRALLKVQLEFGELSLNDALKSPAAAGMKVTQLLQALPYIGPARAGRLLAAAGIPPATTVRALGPRQTEALVRVLSERKTQTP